MSGRRAIPRTTCVVKALPNPAMLIEIECVASLAGR